MSPINRIGGKLCYHCLKEAFTGRPKAKFTGRPEESVATVIDMAGAYSGLQLDHPGDRSPWGDELNCGTRVNTRNPASFN